MYTLYNLCKLALLHVACGACIFADDQCQNELRKPLNPLAKEIINGVRETINGALGIVQHKDDLQNTKEFDSSLRELAQGIADLVLVGIHAKQDPEYRFITQDQLVDDILEMIKAQVI